MTPANKILSLIALGIIAMFAAEVLPALAWWFPPLAIGVLRAYIIIESTRIKNNFPDDYGFAVNWTVGTSVLVAAYIAALWYRGTIGIDLFMSLQTCNIMLIGAELFYSKLSTLSPDRVWIDALQKQIDQYRQEIEGNRVAAETIDLLTEEIGNHKARIGSLESELAGDRLRIESLEMEIEKAHHALTVNSRAIGLGQRLLNGGVKFSAGTVIACPECGTVDLHGHRAKDMRCKKCETVI